MLANKLICSLLRELMYCDFHFHLWKKMLKGFTHFWLSFQKNRYVFECRNEDQKSKSNLELLSGLDYELSIVKYDFK